MAAGIEFQLMPLGGGARRSVAIGGEKPADVAADYGLTRNAVDQIRHRVATRLRALATTLAETT